MPRMNAPTDRSALIEANGWAPVTGMPIGQVRRLAWKYRDRLSQRDQLFLSVRLGSWYPRATPWTVRIADRQRLTQLAPESPEAWYLYADALFHYGALADEHNPLQQSRSGFEQAVRLDSLFGAALTHLSTLAFQIGDSQGTRRWAARFIAMDSATENARLNRWEVLAITRDEPGIRRFLANLEGPTAATIVVFYPRDSVTIARHPELSDVMVRKTNPGPDRANVFRLLHRTALNHGRPAEARRWLDSARAVDRTGNLDYERGALVGGVVWGDDTTGVGEALTRPSTREAEIQLAVVELARGNPDSAERLAGRLRTDPALRDTIGDVHLRRAALLDAWVAVLRRAPGSADKVALADSLYRGRTGGDELVSFILARLNEQAGQPGRALTALRRRHSILGDVVPEGLTALLREEGRLAARNGEREAAIRAYRAFLWWYADPEPSLIPRRDSVRAELDALLKP